MGEKSREREERVRDRQTDRLTETQRHLIRQTKTEKRAQVYKE